MKNTKYVLMFILAATPLFAHANSVQGINPNGTIVEGEEFLLNINMPPPASSISCSLNLDWGDGQKQKIKLGKDGQFKPLPIDMQSIFQVPHTYKSIGAKRIAIASPFWGGCDIDELADTFDAIVISKYEKAEIDKKLAEKKEKEKNKLEAEAKAKQEAEERERLRKESPEYKREQAEIAMRAKQEREAWERAFEKFNIFEKAINPFGGNKELITDIKEEGQRIFMLRWFGVYLRQYSTTSDTKGYVKSIDVTAEMGTSVKQMRAIANSICGFNDTDWKKKELSGTSRISGNAQNTKCESHYDNFTSGDGYVSLVIKRLIEIN